MSGEGGRLLRFLGEISLLPRLQSAILARREYGSASATLHSDENRQKDRCFSHRC